MLQKSLLRSPENVIESKYARECIEILVWTLRNSVYSKHVAKFPPKRHACKIKKCIHFPLPALLNTAVLLRICPLKSYTFRSVNPLSPTSLAGYFY